ncbi:MAG: DUF1778 domain-containing protein [Pseudomonadota bacterium]
MTVTEIDMAETNQQIRLEVPLTPEIHTLLKRAAELERCTIEDFLVDAARAAARQTIEQMKVVCLSREGQAALVQALVTPPELSPATARAIDNHRRLIAPESPPSKA